MLIRMLILLFSDRCVYSTELFLMLRSAMNHNVGKYTSESALMGAVALGHRDALRVVLDRYMPMVSRASYRILCDRDDSEDVTREVFIRIWRNASFFDGRYNISTWIYSITCNLCYDRLRRRKLLSLLSIAPPVYETSAPEARSAEEDFITKETWEIFCRASQNLSPKQRTVFTLHDLEGLDTETVIAVTGLTSDQINSNLYVARMKIRQELERYGKVR